MIYTQYKKFVQENETPKNLCDFGIQTYHLILIKKLDRDSINKKKKTIHLVDFCHSG